MHEPIEQTWELIRGQLRRAVPPAAYDLWLGQLQPHELGDRQLLLAAPDQAARWVADRFGRVLQTSAAAVLGTDVDVDVVPRSHLAGRSTPRAERGAPLRDTDLNPQYTFENFVIGEGNRLAHAAALAVAELPGQAYNPLFICGPPGVGKTHLLHSIAAYARAYGGVSVRCVTADSFTTGFIRALQTGSIDAFKAGYRSAGLLLVDDVQFLQAKARTEEEFFHTFNALYETGSQLVLTSDRPPRDIEALEERLRERFACGLVASIAAPDLETRMTILRKWVRQERAAEVGDEVLRKLAGQVSGNVRALRGALTHLIALSSLRGRAIEDADVAQLLAGQADASSPPVSIRAIQQVTCRAFGLSREELVSSSRAGRVAWPRQLAMYLAREHTDATLPAIGREFGGRDHTTVLHACRRTRKRLAAEPRLERMVTSLVDELRTTSGDRLG